MSVWTTFHCKRLEILSSGADGDSSIVGLTLCQVIISDVSEKHGTHLRTGTSCVFFGIYMYNDRTERISVLQGRLY
jgi:hypothetical protein